MAHCVSAGPANSQPANASPEPLGFPNPNFRVSDRHYASTTTMNSNPKRVLYLFVSQCCVQTQ